MFNLSTQEVVLSIEKTPVIKEKQFVYQHYHNFFGNLQELELDIGNLNFDSLEDQEKFPRKRLSYNEKLSKQLHIFFMNSKITNALAKKFNTDLSIASSSVSNFSSSNVYVFTFFNLSHTSYLHSVYHILNHLH